MNKIAYICILMILLSSLPVRGNEPQAGKEPLNIILIMADDLGYETIGANGGESYKTPHLDRLAASGARFEHCYAQPLCTPSRVQIMTGKYNVRNYTKFGVLPRNETTFAHLLKEAGYATCIAGKWQLGKEKDSPRHFGFDGALLWQHTRSGRMRKDGVHYDKRYENPQLERNGEKESYHNGEYAPDLMVDFICEFIEKNKDGPFLVYYPMILTHCPFVPTPHSEDWNPESLGSPSYKGDAKYFGDMVSYMDGLVGRIANEVEAQGLSEKTVILFTGDNGTDSPVVSLLNGREVAGGKSKTTDAGTRVPLIVHGPGFIKSGVINDLIDFTDFLPTICELTDIDLTAERPVLDGRSFLPQLLGKEGNPRQYVYSWYSRSGKEEEARVFARTHQYKLYRNGDFFDLQQDIDEEAPLAADSLNAEQNQQKATLQGVIDKYDKPRSK
ncbi:MAG: sulfatase-like hydrolase/transferase [Verrucomicrobiota bacterium]